MIINCKTSIVSHNESFYATQLKFHIYFSEPESRDKSLYIKIQKNNYVYLRLGKTYGII